jgi:beta-glucanase (GH16 family)
MSRSAFDVRRRSSLVDQLGDDRTAINSVMIGRTTAAAAIALGLFLTAPSIAWTSIFPLGSQHGVEARHRAPHSSRSPRQLKAISRVGRAVPLTGKRGLPELPSTESSVGNQPPSSRAPASQSEPGPDSSIGIGPAVELKTPQPAWSDEFSGPAEGAPDPTKWQNVVGSDGFGNEELEYYTDSRKNSSLDGNGDLVITARQEDMTNKWEGITRHYTSARLETRGLYGAKYGRMEARIKLPEGQGLWPAFWAVGADEPTVDWPDCGEIDMMEYLGNDPYTTYGSIHGPEVGQENGYGLTTPKKSKESLADDFHRYGVIWTPNKIQFTLDGNVYSTRTKSDLGPGQEWVFDKPFILRLNMGVGGDWPGAPDASTQFPARMLVDWVRVWED